jgi:hypothetical protein
MPGPDFSVSRDANSAHVRARHLGGVIRVDVATGQVHTPSAWIFLLQVSRAAVMTQKGGTNLWTRYANVPRRELLMSGEPVTPKKPAI